MPPDSPFDTPWMGPRREQWLREVEAWLDGGAQAADLGERVSITVVKERPWAAVLRVRFKEGIAYFKAPGPCGRAELAVLEWLHAASDGGGLAPRLLASRKDAAWMLLADAGRPLRDLPAQEARLRATASAMALYGSVQRRSVDELATLRALGLPELALETLPDRLQSLLQEPLFVEAVDAQTLRAMATQLHALLPELRARLAALPRRPWSTALDHGDFHDGNLLVDGASLTLCDWGDACLTHPLVSLGRLLAGAVQAAPASRQAAALEGLLSAYLMAWDEPCELAKELPLVLWLSHAVRVLSYARVFAAADLQHRTTWMPVACSAWAYFVRSKDAYLAGELLDALRLPLD